jgi:transcriptional regulator
MSSSERYQKTGYSKGPGKPAKGLGGIRTQAEVARLLGISRGRVSMIENRAINKLIAGGALDLLKEMRSR